MPADPIFQATAVELAQVVGEEAAHGLLHHFGGRRLYVPRQIGDGHPIAVAIGPKAAALLSEFYHGAILYFPIVQSRRERIVLMAGRGMPAPQIATALSVSERLVYQVLADHRQNRDQLQLL